MNFSLGSEEGNAPAECSHIVGNWCARHYTMIWKRIESVKYGLSCCSTLNVGYTRYFCFVCHSISALRERTCMCTCTWTCYQLGIVIARVPIQLNSFHISTGQFYVYFVVEPYNCGHKNWTPSVCCSLDNICVSYSVPYLYFSVGRSSAFELLSSYVLDQLLPQLRTEQCKKW